MLHVEDEVTLDESPVFRYVKIDVFLYLMELAMAKDRFDYVLLDDCSYLLFGEVLEKLVAAFSLASIRPI